MARALEARLLLLTNDEGLEAAPASNAGAIHQTHLLPPSPNLAGAETPPLHPLPPPPPFPLAPPLPEVRDAG